MKPIIQTELKCIIEMESSNICHTYQLAKLFYFYEEYITFKNYSFAVLEVIKTKGTIYFLY